MELHLKEIVAGLFLLAGTARLSAADAAATGTPKVYPQSTATTSVAGTPLKFVKVTKPSFPYWLKQEVLATRDMKYNAIVKITIDHGKIVSVVPCGGNEALAKHLASTVQKNGSPTPE